MFEKFMYIILTICFVEPLFKLFYHVSTGTPWIN